MLGGYIATDPANERRALDGLLSEFEKIRDRATPSPRSSSARSAT